MAESPTDKMRNYFKSSSSASDTLFAMLDNLKRTEQATIVPEHSPAETSTPFNEVTNPKPQTQPTADIYNMPAPQQQQRTQDRPHPAAPNRPEFAA